jgi:CRP-like cAMP-binding protein
MSKRSAKMSAKTSFSEKAGQMTREMDNYYNFKKEKKNGMRPVRAKLWVDGELCDHEKVDFDNNRMVNKSMHRGTLYRYIHLNESKERVVREASLSYAGSHGMLHPQGKIKSAWDFIIGLFIIYSIISVPIETAFQMELSPALRSFEYFVDVMFLTDVVINFRTVYFDEVEDAYIAIPSLIAAKYLKLWFYIDFFSSVPIDSVMNWVLHKSLAGLKNIRLLKIIRLSRLLKLARVLKLGRIIVTIEDQLGVSPALFELLSMLTQIFLVAHLVACFWWGISITMTNHGWFDAQQVGGDLNTMSVDEQYIAALYMIVTTLTTTGYGDYYPSNTSERLVMLVIMCVGASTFGYIMGSVAGLVGSFTSTSASDERITAINSFLSEKNCPDELATSIVRHFRHKSSEVSATNELAILERLPKRMQVKLVMTDQHDKMSLIPLFQYIDNDSVKVHIFKMMIQHFYEMDQVILSEGDMASSIIFLVKGKARVFHQKELRQFRKEQHRKQEDRNKRANRVKSIATVQELVEESKRTNAMQMRNKALIVGDDTAANRMHRRNSRPDISPGQTTKGAATHVYDLELGDDNDALSSAGKIIDRGIMMLNRAMSTKDLTGTSSSKKQTARQGGGLSLKTHGESKEESEPGDNGQTHSISQTAQSAVAAAQEFAAQLDKELDEFTSNLPTIASMSKQVVEEAKEIQKTAATVLASAENAVESTISFVEDGARRVGADINSRIKKQMNRPHEEPASVASRNNSVASSVPGRSDGRNSPVASDPDAANLKTKATDFLRKFKVPGKSKDGEEQPSTAAAKSGSNVPFHLMSEAELTASGRAFIIDVGPGDFVGAGAMAKGCEVKASVRALEPCSAFILKRDDINELVEKEPGIAVVLQMALGRIMHENRHIIAAKKARRSQTDFIADLRARFGAKLRATASVQRLDTSDSKSNLATRASRRGSVTNLFRRSYVPRAKVFVGPDTVGPDASPVTDSGQPNEATALNVESTFDEEDATPQFHRPRNRPSYEEILPQTKNGEADAADSDDSSGDSSPAPAPDAETELGQKAIDKLLAESIDAVENTKPVAWPTAHPASHQPTSQKPAESKLATRDSVSSTQSSVPSQNPRRRHSLMSGTFIVGGAPKMDDRETKLEAKLAQFYLNHSREDEGFSPGDLNRDVSRLNTSSVSSINTAPSGHRLSSLVLRAGSLDEPQQTPQQQVVQTQPTVGWRALARAARIRRNRSCSDMQEIADGANEFEQLGVTYVEGEQAVRQHESKYNLQYYALQRRQSFPSVDNQQWSEYTAGDAFV